MLKFWCVKQKEDSVEYWWVEHYNYLVNTQSNLNVDMTFILNVGQQFLECWELEHREKNALLSRVETSFWSVDTTLGVVLRAHHHSTWKTLPSKQRVGRDPTVDKLLTK